MADIVEQLRTENSFPPYYGAPKLQHDAADEIESLRFQLNGVIKMRNEVENEITRLRAEMAAKLSALMDTHDDMADDLENMRQALLDIVAVIGLVGTNCGGRVMKIAKFALGGENG